MIYLMLKSISLGNLMSSTKTQTQTQIQTSTLPTPTHVDVNQEKLQRKRRRKKKISTLTPEQIKREQERLETAAIRAATYKEIRKEYAEEISWEIRDAVDDERMKWEPCYGSDQGGGP